MVIASSRKFSDEDRTLGGQAMLDGKQMNSDNAENTPPISAMRAGTPAWTAEPWNGRKTKISRQMSIRKPAGGPAPPMPGMESNVGNCLDSVQENPAQTEIEEHEDGSERGRLFVKVLGVRDLSLPLPQNETLQFQLTLDNGLHCVTTSSLELRKSAPIDQEFELVVFNDLEFQMTLQTKLEQPQRPVSAPKPTNKIQKIQKTSHFSRFLVSPRKRKEDRKQQQIQEMERITDQNVKFTEPTGWDLLHRFVGTDGSFARAYVSLEEFENLAFGRPHVVEIPCFNEWAQNDDSVSSRVTSKRGGTVNKPPYCVGQMRLQLLYVPKPKGAKDEEMPKSINACIRELAEAEKTKARQHSGFLSQQGGDCPFWRRRWFQLNGTKLTAYHETTRQLRANINLAKAKKIVDDRNQLVQKEVSARGGKRRKSAFAEEEDGYMFVEEGFRIRFANGETIDFYADSAADKDGWMGVLADVVGIPSGVARTSWTNIVLKREQGGALPAHKQVLLESKPTISSSPFRQSVPIKGTKEPSSVPAHFRNSAIPATQISPWQRAMKRGR